MAPTLPSTVLPRRCERLSRTRSNSINRIPLELNTMKRNWMALAAISLTVTLAGCAGGPPGGKTALLTYETQPEGATLMEDGVAIGVEPVTRTYRIDPQSDSVKTPVVTAVWPSGAKATFWTVLKPGADEVATLKRPPAAPGLAQDQAKAAEVLATRQALSSEQAQKIRQERARASSACQRQLSGGASGNPVDACR
jgi:hypothetical protein